jgi:hypothetical protein
MLSRKRKLGRGLAVVGAGVTKAKSMCHLRTHKTRCKTSSTCGFIIAQEPETLRFLGVNLHLRFLINLGFLVILLLD